MPWIVVLALVVHSEKKVIGLGLCICEVRGGTRYILRFFLAVRTSVLSFPLYMTILVIIQCALCIALCWTLADDEFTVL